MENKRKTSAEPEHFYPEAKETSEAIISDLRLGKKRGYTMHFGPRIRIMFKNYPYIIWKLGRKKRKISMDLLSSVQTKSYLDEFIKSYGNKTKSDENNIF